MAIVIGALIALAGGSALAAYHYDRSTANELLPGVRIEGVDVGGMTRHEALLAVKSRVQVSLSDQLTVRAGHNTWRVAPADLGVRADVKSSVERAFGFDDTLSWFAFITHYGAVRVARPGS